MNVLAFDTATRATSVALCLGERDQLESRDDPPQGERPRHASRLMPLIDELLDSAGIDWPQIDRIAVGVGPGTFTGLRIGVATARALALAREVPLAAVSTLESLALNAGGATGQAGSVLAVLDARRGEAFAAAWTLPNFTRMLDAAALKPDQLAASVPGGALALGEGAIEFRAVLERAGALVPHDESALHRLTAKNHCRLGRRAQPARPQEIHPQYLRLPDAEIARRAAASK